MSAHPTERALTALAAGLACLAVALVFAAPALARPHEYTAAFGAKCLAEPGCVGESLFKPNGVAVNDAPGDVYVVDEGTGGVGGRVVVFSSAGVYQSEIDGSGLLAGEEHAAGSLGRAGEVETGKFSEPQTIAVDNSCVIRKVSEPSLTQAKCEEEDPSSGDVYIVDAGAGHRVVDKYSPGGEYLGQISGGEARFAENIDGVAVDTKGTVWVYQERPQVSSFSDATPNVFNPGSLTHMNGLGGFGKPGFAVDGAGDFYLRLRVSGVTRIAKEDPAANVLIENVGGKAASAVAADQISYDSVVDKLTSLGVFNPEGEELERLGEEEGAKALGEGLVVVVYTATS